MIAIAIENKFFIKNKKRGGALDIIDDAPPLGNDVRERGKVRVCEHDLRHLAGNIASRGHGDGAVGFLEREHIVHAVAGHGHGVSLLFEREDEPALHLRRHAAEDNALARRLLDLFVGFERAGVHRPVRVGIPARRATSETVSGLSPEITRTETPSRANHANVSGASARILLESNMSEMGRRSAVSASSVSCPS